MKMLCIDCGNTFCKAAIIENEAIILVLQFQLADFALRLTPIIKAHQPSISVLSAVITHSDDFVLYLQQYTNCIELNYQLQLPFKLLYQTPKTLGKDRLALVAAAATMYPNQASLVIACGTCITYNFINTQNEFLGGAIAPGLIMRFKAMHHFTQKLPLVANENHVALIGTDTTSSLQSGVVNGVIAEIDGVIKMYQERHPKINVVLTGGDMPQLHTQLKSRIFADANFLFKGLYQIGLCNSH